MSSRFGVVDRATSLKAAASAHFQAGRYAIAERVFAKAVRKDSNDFDALFGLGSAALAAGSVDVAVRSFERAVRLRPNDIGALSNLATALLQAKKSQDSVLLARRAFELSPDNLFLALNLANSQIESGDAKGALDTLRSIPQEHALQTDVILLKGSALFALNQLEEALVELRRAFSAEPRLDSGKMLFHALLRHGRPIEALGVLDQLDRLEINSDVLDFERAKCFECACRADAAYELADKVAQTSNDAELRRAAATFAAMQSLYHEDLSIETASVAHMRAGALQEKVEPIGRRAFNAACDDELRIGIVSPDLRWHSVLCFLLGPLSKFKAAGGSIHAFSASPLVDRFTEIVMNSVDSFHNIAGMDEGRAAKLVAKQGLDVLIDLGGYTDNMPIGIFARAPSHCQISWLGYPASLGFKRIHARVTDAWADPESNKTTEELIRLPYFLSYMPLVNAPAPSLRPDRPVVFGCFNNPKKIGPASVAHWARILRAVPNSILMLRGRQYRIEGVTERIVAMLAAHGVATTQINAGPFEFDCNEATFMTYSQVDIALDPIVYNGTTTTCEALWMGVPLVAFPGDRHSARVGVSLLKTAGLDELVAADAAQARDMIVALANDRSRLARYRTNLRPSIQASKLTDHADFAQNFVAALREFVADRTSNL